MAVYAAESSRLWLQALNVEEHLQDYFEIMSSPGSMLWSRGAPHKDIEETRLLMLDSFPTPEKPWNQRWAIMLKPSPSSETKSVIEDGSDSDSHAKAEKPKMIGIVGTPRKSELAYKINPEYWGKGYMSETLTMFLRMFWESEENKGFMRLEAGADPENVGSVRVLEKAGFQRGEYVRDFHVRAVNEGGKMSDMQFFYLDRP
ncbi:acyl-CoA N-acyltransferase [Cadophora sp. DSE1049]|nr:acyl-CoA N-acyltransferase [Cadophora sp. DSE1049]